MKRLSLNRAECERVERALRFYIADLQRDIYRREEEGGNPAALREELAKWRTLKVKFEP